MTVIFRYGSRSISVTTAACASLQSAFLKIRLCGNILVDSLLYVALKLKLTGSQTQSSGLIIQVTDADVEVIFIFWALMVGTKNKHGFFF